MQQAWLRATPWLVLVVALAPFSAEAQGQSWTNRFGGVHVAP